MVVYNVNDVKLRRRFRLGFKSAKSEGGKRWQDYNLICVCDSA